MHLHCGRWRSVTLVVRFFSLGAFRMISTGAARMSQKMRNTYAIVYLSGTIAVGPQGAKYT